MKKGNATTPGTLAAYLLFRYKASERQALPADSCVCARVCVCTCVYVFFQLRPVSYRSPPASDVGLASGSPGPSCIAGCSSSCRGISEVQARAKRPTDATRYWFCVEIPKRTITLNTDKKESIKLLVITHSSQWEKVLMNTRG